MLTRETRVLTVVAEKSALTVRIFKAGIDMKKKSNLSTILLVAVFFVGLSVLLYPTISDFWNEKRQSQAIIDYDSLIETIEKNDSSSELEKAKEYNKKISSMPFPFINHKQLTDDYYRILDVNGEGMMGYITIEKIKVQLPIYHGTSNEVLNSAVGHVEGSSLPVGEKGSHSVFSAHRGLPSAKLFTNLDKLEVGDVFTLKIFDRVLTYEVDRIIIVLPEQIDDLYTVPGEDYCTLVTCTPYGINTHRLLVRGTRIETKEEEKEVNIITEAYQIDPLIVTPAVAAPMLAVLLVALLIKGRKKKSK